MLKFAPTFPRIFLIFLFAPFLAFLGCSNEAGDPERGVGSKPPVYVVDVVLGRISEWRSYSGSLIASSSSVVSPKIAGRLNAILVHVGDQVLPGQVVAQMEPAEYQQGALQAEADLLLEQANQYQVESELDLAQGAIARAEALSQRGVLSQVELDTANSEYLAKEAAVKVAQARVARAQALLSNARLLLADADVKILPTRLESTLVVAERYLDAGETLSVNTPLLRIVSMDPVLAVFYVAERDYASLSLGQLVRLTTDAYGDRVFLGQIARMAPVFQESSRQARVEVTIENVDQALKPGMFIQAEVELRREENAQVVPAEALIKRNDRPGVFMIVEGSTAVQWREVEVGIREGNQVQIIAAGVTGAVVTLGQQLIKDGMEVSIIENTRLIPSSR